VTDEKPSTTDGLSRLDRLVEHLRSANGCPWDRQQSIEDLRAYLLEEAHEVAAAIDEGNWQELEGELGDLLFLIVFCARLGAERRELTIHSVIDRVEAKMVARHPHVFGGDRLADAQAVRHSWERRKLAEESRPGSMLDGVANSLPALVSTYRMSQKAAGVGFDWSHSTAVLDKVDEELAELRTEIESGTAAGRREEIGDLLFSLANLARHLNIDPEGALAASNLKFRRRFAWIETALATTGRTPAEAEMEELESLWREAKGSGL